MARVGLVVLILRAFVFGYNSGRVLAKLGARPDHSRMGGSALLHPPTGRGFMVLGMPIGHRMGEQADQRRATAAPRTACPAGSAVRVAAAGTVRGAPLQPRAPHGATPGGRRTRCSPCSAIWDMFLACIGGASEPGASAARQVAEWAGWAV